MTENQKPYDPYEAADEAQPRARTFFGQVHFDIWPCILQKGVGKVPFDPALHKVEQRRTAIQICIVPLPSSNATFTTDRNYVDFEDDWTRITNPSIKALGSSCRSLHDKYVKYELVPTGRKYVNSLGEERTATAIRFLAIYNTLEEAEAAAAALYGGKSEPTLAPAPPIPDEHPERLVALKFLPALVTQAGGDPVKLDTILKANPLVFRYFNIGSPEVIALLTPKPEVPF